MLKATVDNASARRNNRARNAMVAVKYSARVTMKNTAAITELSSQLVRAKIQLLNGELYR
jgi:hypothetical protein